MNSKQEVQEALELLASVYRIPTPILRWSNKTRNGRSYPHIHAISIGINVWAGIENVLLHEFSHILHYRLPHAKTKRREVHGSAFYSCLLGVIREWYGVGNEYKYNWHNDYPRIHSIAVSSGYSNKPHHKKRRLP